jgi:hypothetical protein
VYEFFKNIINQKTGKDVGKIVIELREDGKKMTISDVVSSLPEDVQIGNIMELAE